jgi:hypothetical protein
LPAARDDDDDDVAWALQTAAVQWQRGSPADAVVWLRRAVDAAIEGGSAERATELNRAALRLSEHLLAEQEAPSEEPASEVSHGVDELLDAVPAPAGHVAGSGDDDEIVVDDVADLHEGAAYPQRASGAYPGRPGGEYSAHAGGEYAELVEDEDQISETDLEVIDVDSIEEDVADAERYDDQDEYADAAYESADEEVSARRGPYPEQDGEAYAPEQDDEQGDAAEPQAHNEAPARAGVPGPRRAEADDELDAPTGRPPPPLGSVPDPFPAEPVIGAVSLTEVRGFEDLPPDAQLELVRLARVEELGSDEELNGFGVALVVAGWVSIMPAIADTACARASEGEVVFTRGSLADGVALRVVAGEDGTRIATWDTDLIESKLADCPWVIDELRVVADRLQALAGVCMGKMGERLDDSLRGIVTDRCEVKQLLPDEVLLERGQRVGGMYIVGAGRLHVFDTDGNLSEELAPGDFLFAAQVLGGGTAPATVRAGGGGALLLAADRMAAHELLVSVPPLLEILAS